MKTLNKTLVSTSAGTSTGVTGA
ncbi:MAG: hypothetical protein QOC85_3685, partial [Streptomyces sp.]|nr:hypothetical protein [Streptomyces sp.]